MKKILLLKMLLVTLFLLGCSVESPVFNEEGSTSGEGQIVDEVNNVQSDNSMESGIVRLPAKGSYEVDTSQSQLIWRASRLAASPHVGKIAISSGNIVVDDGVTGSFIIDMTSITEQKNNDRFLGHLKSDDFFNVAEFPESTFLLHAVEPQKNDVLVSGDLTILGKTNEIVFPAKIENEHIKAVFTIDRTRWGITYDSGSFFADLGDRAIKDDITFGMNLVLK